MLVAIIIEIPFPIPLSETCSPNHIKNIVPATTEKTAETKNAVPGTYARPLAERVTASADAWIKAKTAVPYLVYWVILFLPACPSFLSSIKYGIEFEKSCIIIAEEIYGTTFSANILILSKAPPENKLNISIIVPWFCWKSEANLSGSIPGIGICDPILYTRIAKKTNRNLFQRSLMLPWSAIFNHYPHYLIYLLYLYCYFAFPNQLLFHLHFQ